MKRLSGLVLCALILGTCVFTATYLWAAGVTTRPSTALEGAANPKWIISAAKHTAVYVDDGKSLDTPQLVVNDLALGESGIELQVSSDAHGFRLRDEAHNLMFATSSTKSDALFLSMDSSDGKIVLNGTELEAQKGPWLQMMNGRAGALRIQFVGATYVNCKYILAAKASAPAAEPLVKREAPNNAENSPSNESVAPVVPVTTAKPIPVTIAGPKSLQQVAQCTFNLDVKDSSRDVYASGTGFLVSADGLGVTNFHVVHGASFGTATFPSTGKKFPVELCAVDPGFDLAVVRLQSKTPTDFPGYLSLATNPAAVGTEVWAIGYPEFGLTVTKGIVTGLREMGALPAKYRKTLGYRRNRSGFKQIARSTMEIPAALWWMRPGRCWGSIHGLRQKLRMRTLRSVSVTRNIFCPRYQKRRLHLPGAVRQYGSEETPTGSFPRISVVRTQKASAITDRVTSLVLGMECSKCKGTGKILHSVKIGEERAGAFVQPIMREEEIACDVCGGKGYNATAFSKQAEQLVDVIARINPDDKDRKSRLEDAASRIWKMATK